MYTANNYLNQNQQPSSQGQVKIIGNYSYNLKYCLGEGAYGKVYEGVESKTQKKVAIKKMDIKSFERDTYLKNQIIAEIDILKKFNHRNIVQFIDLITTQRSLYIITEYCGNGDLRNLMQHKRLTEEQSIKIMRHIVEGFKELIKHNVIHRDLKPANILIHDGVFKIGDFGFAKYVDYSSAQMLRSCVGSPLYMAPQILRRQQYGTKCDIWSLGIIFHEMVFGDVPWKARDERELLSNITHQPYRMKAGVKVSKFTEDILKRMLVVDEYKRIGWDELFNTFKQYEEKLYINTNQQQQQQQQANLPPKLTHQNSNKENVYQGLFQGKEQQNTNNNQIGYQKQNSHGVIRKSIFEKVRKEKKKNSTICFNNEKENYYKEYRKNVERDLQQYQKNKNNKKPSTEIQQRKKSNSLYGALNNHKNYNQNNKFNLNFMR